MRTSSPRVAFVGPLPPWRSGIADQGLRLLRALRRLGVEAEAVTFRRMYPRFLYPGASDRGPGGYPAELGPVSAVLDGSNPLTFRLAGRELSTRGVSLVLVPWWTAYFAPHVSALLGSLAAASPSTVKLLLCHNVFDHEEGAVKRALARAVFRRADRFAVQSSRAATELRAVRPDAPLEVIPHPAEPRGVLPSREEARRRLGLPADAPLFLFSGLLRPYKGWDVLLDAFARVREEIPGACLVLAGEPWGEAKALARGAPPPGIRLELRYLPEEERSLWFSACDAVVCPYRRASGSGIAADAFAHGRPVIGTRVDGLADAVEEGDSGLLVPPGDGAALAEAMTRFVREGLGPRLSAGALKARERFSPEEHARRILRLGGIPA